MDNNFSEEKSTVDNVKISIDKILNSKTTLKKKPKTVEDKRKELFKNFVESFEEAVIRSETLFTLYGMNNEAYDNTFLEAIDNLALLMFSEAQLSLIDWYVHERFTPDGDMLALESSDGSPILLETSDHLWEYLKLIK